MHIVQNSYYEITDRYLNFNYMMKRCIAKEWVFCEEAHSRLNICPKPHTCYENEQ